MKPATDLQHHTGRFYGPTEQVLDITIESMSTDEFGFTAFVATFIDASRGISGRVSSLAIDRDIGGAVLACYDAGKYELI